MISAGSKMRPCASATPAIPRKSTIRGSARQKRRARTDSQSLFIEFLSKRRRRIDPQHPGFFAAGVFPAMRNGAFKIKAVAWLQPIVLGFIQPDFKVTSKNMKELLSFVRVGLPAAAAGLDAKEVGLHRCASPGQ